jgi:hypothetical protein
MTYIIILLLLFKHDQLKQTLLPLEKHFSQPVPHEKLLVRQNEMLMML